MSLRSIALPFVAISLGLGALAAAPAGPTFAEAAKSGKSLVVPEAHKGLGTVYHAIPDRDAQVSFASKAPLENIEGNSNGVIGYAVVGKDDEPAHLQAGEWHLPVKSMRTGITMRDGHLASAGWLDAAQYPDIVFQLKDVADITAGKAEGDTKAFTVTLKGEMTIHGVTKEVSYPDCTITFRKGSASTESVAKGDLLSIRAKYDIALADYGVSNKVVGQKVADTINVDTNLILSTVAPEDQAPADGAKAKDADKPAK